MLDSFYIAKSRVRRNLLGFLFSHPKEKYYLSELARQVHASPGNVQRELNRFLEDELIHREKKGNLIFYSLNFKHALFPEIDALVRKTMGIETGITHLVDKLPEIKLALLYGSFASHQERGESDIDLLVISDGEIDLFYKALTQLENQFNREINPTIYSPLEFRKKLARKDSFIMHVLNQPYRILKGQLE